MRLPVSFLLLLALLGRAGAEPLAPVSRTTRYSKYEERVMAKALAQLGGELDPAAEGKVVEAIEVLSLDVFEEGDPAAQLLMDSISLPRSLWGRGPRGESLNVLHTTTRPFVVRREVLLSVGDPYRKVIVDETARNLRRLTPLSLVVCFPIRSKHEGKVRLAVVTKDVWSLRSSFNVNVSPGGLESLQLEPTEWNLVGSHHLVLGRFVLQPESLSLGAGYRVPRLDGRWLSFVADANIIMNRRSGQPEGSFGTFSITRPLYSTRTEWGWSVGTTFRDEVVRRYVGARLALFDAKNATPNEEDNIPMQFRGRRLITSASVTRSFGWANKEDFALGAELNVRNNSLFGMEAFAPAAVNEFRNRFVRVSDTRVGPYAQLRAYTTNFLRITDFETLALQEDVRLGHEFWLRVYPVSSALGATRSFFGTYAAAQYTVPLKDGFVRAGGESTAEFQSESVPDAALAGNLRVVSPSTKVGRLVYDATVVSRYRNAMNAQTLAGGDERLRGFPSNFFSGKDFLASNLEFRTRPVEILSAQLGAAAFYDIGDAFDGWEKLRPWHAAGVGLRGLFPQLNRVVARADLAYVLTRPLPAGVGSASFFIAFEQAFPFSGVGGSSAGASLTGAGGGALGQ